MSAEPRVETTTAPGSVEDEALAWSWPDYAGGGAANLMASLVDALAPTWRERCGALPVCGALPSERVSEARHVVLVVIDGLGSHQLMQHADGGFLASAHVADLSAVFPSTTSSAITTYMTAQVPAAHALTGWHTWFPRLGTIGTPLPFTMRASGASLADAGAMPESMFSGLGLFDAMQRHARLVHPKYLVDSHYSRAHGGHAEMRGFKGLDGLAAELKRVARARDTDFSYAYWPDLDARSHVHGAGSPSARVHLLEIERMLERVWSRIEGSGTLLLVTADHGFVDTNNDTRHALDDHPELARCLLMPLTGEPRTAFCHLRSGAREDAEAYVAEYLHDVCEAHDSHGLIEDGLFGPPALAHPELGARIGDLCLLMKRNHVLTDRVPREGPFSQVGVHGGLSATEMRIPLIALGP